MFVVAELNDSSPSQTLSRFGTLVRQAHYWQVEPSFQIV